MRPDINIVRLHQKGYLLLFRENQHRPLEEVLSFSQQAFHHLLAVVQSLPEEELTANSPSFKPLLPAYWPDEPLWETIAGDSYEHYHQHFPDILVWLNDR